MCSTLTLVTLFCQDLATQQQQNHVTDGGAISTTHQLALISIINADGIYLATYSALLLNLKLVKLGYYQQDIRPVPLTEVGSVFGEDSCVGVVFLLEVW